MGTCQEDDEGEWDLDPSDLGQSGPDPSDLDRSDLGLPGPDPSDLDRSGPDPAGQDPRAPDMSDQARAADDRDRAARGIPSSLARPARRLTRRRRAFWLLTGASDARAGAHSRRH